MHFEDLNNNKVPKNNNDIKKLQDLKKDFKVLQTSDRALNMIIISLILSSMNINKSKVEILDKINGTNYAEKLHDSRNFERLSNELSLIGSSMFWDLAKNKLNDRKEEFNKIDNLEMKNKLDDANKNYVITTLYFLAAIIDCC